MVPDVEHFSTELDLGAFRGIPSRTATEPGNARDLEDGQIPVVDSRASHRVSSAIAESAEGRLGKGGCVTRLARSSVRFIQSGVGYDIRALADSKISQACIFVLEADV